MLLQSFKNTGRRALSRYGGSLSGLALSREFDRDPLLALESGERELGDIFPVELGNARVMAIRGEAAAELALHQLALERGHTLDSALFAGPPSWRSIWTPPAESSMPLGRALEDRALRLQIERAVSAGAARLQSWGETGQRTLVGAMAELSTAMSVAAVAGATLDAQSRHELQTLYLGWQRDDAMHYDLPGSLRGRLSLGEIVGRLEGHAPRWLQRASARARKTVLALLREAIVKGARRSHQRAPSAQESDLLRLTCEPSAPRRDLDARAELLLSLLERVQRFVQHGCSALLQRCCSAANELDQLLEEQDWVFGDQGDITYETLRPLEELRAMLESETARDPLHLALLAPSRQMLRVSATTIERGTHLLVGAPIPHDLIEERAGEPLALALASLVLQKLELLDAPDDMLRFRQRSG